MLPILIHTRRFPPQRFHAITLFPFVFFNGEKLKDREIRHETVHIWQQAALLVVFFYLLYIIFLIVEMARHRDRFKAYLAIPFEKSAYRLEKQKEISKTAMAFDWLNIMNQKS